MSSKTLAPRAGSRLSARGVTKRYAGVTVLNNLDIELAPNELVGLIGPNGSGKTTFIDCVTRVLDMDGGDVALDGQDVSRYPAHGLSRAGLLRTFQTVRVFGSMSVRENLQAGFWAARHAVDAAAVVMIARDLGLAEHLAAPARTLSYGQRKLLEFGSVVLARPRVLLLDEPVASVNPTLALVLREHIARLHARGTTILIVEHNIEFIVGLCTRLIVLDRGERIADGVPSEVIAEPAVHAAYFGR